MLKEALPKQTIYSDKPARVIVDDFHPANEADLNEKPVFYPHHLLYCMRMVEEFEHQTIRHLRQK